MEKRIQTDIMSAMKEKNEVKLAALRSVKTAIMAAKTSANFSGDRTAYLSDVEVVKILQKLIKEREDSYNIYNSAGRTELAEKEKNEMAILQGYLPKQLSETELTKLVESTITETGASSISDMGKVISLVMKKANGRSDGKSISSVVKKMLTTKE